MDEEKGKKRKKTKAQKEAEKFRVCSFCHSIGPPGIKYPMCTRCKSARYCCREHQKAHWKAHKQGCKIDESTEPLKQPLQPESQLSQIAESARKVLEDPKKTPLINAAADGNVARCKKILAKGNVDLSFKATFGDTALHAACRNGHACAVKLLAKQSTANLELRNTSGATALKLAVMFGYHACVRHLCEAKADVNTRSKDGSTVLQTAIHVKNSAECVKALLEYGADVTMGWVQGRTTENIFDVLMTPRERLSCFQETPPFATFQLIVAAAGKANMTVPPDVLFYMNLLAQRPI